jgi:hypothetical protein
MLLSILATVGTLVESMALSNSVRILFMKSATPSGPAP